MNRNLLSAPNVINFIYKTLKTHKHFTYLFTLFLLPLCGYGQCAGIANNACTTAAPTVISTSISCTPPVTQGGRRNFLVTNMIAGATYRVSNCGSGYNTQMTIRDSSDTVVASNDDNGPACSGTEASIDFIPPTTGDYRIHLNRFDCATTNNLNGDIVVTYTSAPTPPSNNDCTNAITLTTNLSCSFATYTNLNATDSGETPTPGCSSYLGGDVWFSVVVPAAGSLEIDTNTGVITDGGMAVYSGTCGSLALVACDDDSSANGLMPYLSLTGQTPGNTLYIRFFERGNDNNGTFDICAIEPPPPCSPPTTQPTSLTFGTITGNAINGSFNAASPTPDNYLIVANTTNTPPSPVDGISYNIGDTIGAGNTVVDNDSNLTFTATGLNSTTTYYFFIYSFNDSACTGGPSYNTTSPLTDNATTTVPSYCTPSSTDSNYYINDFSTTGGTTNITNNGSGYSLGGYGDFTGQTVTQTAGGTINFSGAFIGGGAGDFGANIWVDYNNDYDFDDAGEQVFGSGAYVTGITGSFAIPTATTPGSYRMRVLIDYFTTNPNSCTYVSDRGETEDYTLVVGTPPACTTPTAQATALTFGAVTSSTIAGSFTAASPTPDNYLVVVNTSGTPPTPSNTTSYNIGDTVGAGNTVVDNDNNVNFSASGLSITTTYYFFIFSYDNLGCTGGPLYNTTAPLTGNATTSSIATYCEPASTSDETFLYIDDVEFIGTLNDVTNLNNSYSSVATVGYQDWTGLTNSIQAQGEGINVFLESNNSRGHIKVWVDWDLDGLFEETASELVYDTGTIATSSTTFGFIIPPNQALGDYRMRIKLYNSYNGPTESYSYDFNSCEDFNTNGSFTEYGETEDYTFTVIQSCGATIDSITEGFNCGPGTVNLSVTGSSSTIQYKWYDSDVAVTPLATTPNGNWITPSISSTTDYYVTADNGTCESLVRTKLTATINPITTLSFSPSVPEVCGEDDIIQISATSANEIAYLIDEDFEGSGLGSMTNNNIRDHSVGESAITMWQQRTSTFIPSEQVWFPAISSGFGTNKFAMATSDTGTSNITENALESATLDSSTFTSLTLSFDIYFSRYLFTAGIPENVNIEVSTNGGTSWTTIHTYDDDIGYGTNMTNVSFDLSAYVDQTNLKVRIRYFADYWCDGVAVDNIQLYGSRPVLSSFTWTSPTSIDAYVDAAATIPYAGTKVNTVYIKPTTTQLQSNTFSFVATATLDNGCDVSANITINNRTKYWDGTSSTDWNDPTNWLPSGVPTANNCVIIPNQTIISGTAYEAYAKNLTVRPTGDLELQSGNNLIVSDWVVVDTNGIFNIRDSASLIQINNDANSGIVKVERDTQPVYRYDYTYWSSPMTTTSGFKLLQLSPDTLGDKFFSWQSTVSNGHGIWILENATTTDMINGTGYAIRAPQTFSTNPATKVVYTGTFEGTPANGDINVPVVIGTDANIGTTYGDTTVAADDDQWHFIGNPYPSAIDIVSFLNDATNSPLLDGTIYLWTHNTPPSSSYPDPFYADYAANYTGSDYATVNSLGTANTAASGGLTPSRYIASGQSFFVLGLNNGTAVFDNTMRVKNDNGTFLKTTETDLEKHRIWLNLSNEEEAFSQVLIGYVDGATLNWDRGLDGLSNSGNFVTFYSIIPDGNLAIQGRPLPFYDSDVVQLGFKATVANSYRIGLDHIDDLFVDQDIFIKDNDLNFTHNLKSAPYIFYSDIGVFDDRFELIYRDQTLSVDEVIEDENTIKVISNETLSVVSSTKNIKEITAYDLLGRILQNYDDINTTEITLKGIQKGNRMLLLKITLDNNNVIYNQVIY